MKLKAQKKGKSIDVVVIFVLLLVFMALMTYVLPAGSFKTIEDEATGRTVYVAGSYTQVEKNPTTIAQFLTAVMRGMEKNSDIIFFVLIIGACFNVITETGVIRRMTISASRKFTGDKAYVAIAIFMLIFTILGTTMGFSQECILFTPIGIAMARALGFDAFIGFAMVVIGAYIGYTVGVINPFNTGVAQGIAQVPLYTDAIPRLVMLVLFYVVTLFYLLRYAKKIRKDPALGMNYEQELEYLQKGKQSVTETEEGLRAIDWACLAVMIGGMAFLIYGVSQRDWWFEEMSALFLSMGLVVGILGKLRVKQIIDAFLDGMKQVVLPVLILGLAGALVIIITDAGIIDTIVNACANLVSGFPPTLSAIGMYVVQTLINLPIPSGTSQAAVTMPLMTPIADLIGVSREAAVLAFNFGDGFSNLIWPTQSTVMTCVAMAAIPYGKWIKWMLKLFVIWSVLSCICLMIYANVLYPL